MKYAFNAGAETVNEGFGISEERCDFIMQKAKEIAFRTVLTDEAMDNTVKALELFINDVQPKGEAEALFAGFLFGGTIETIEKIANGLVEKMRL